jgi:TolB protein
MKKLPPVMLIVIITMIACQETLTAPPMADMTAVPATTQPMEMATDTSIPDKINAVIAFYSDRDGNPEIYTILPDGSEPTRLTNDPAFDDSPAVSPDGKQIAFLTARHDPAPSFPNLKYELYVMDIDGKNLLRLTDTEAAEDHPAWSPDESRIIFDADYDGDGFFEIYTIKRDGSNLIRLTTNPANDQFADWSPDGTQIAFSSYRNGNWDIYVMDANGNNQHPLTESPDWELFPAWSPDGTQIAFNALKPKSRNTDIFVMNADGSNTRQLTDTPRFDENPVWSPDGTQIAFQTDRDRNFEIYIMNADGSNPHPLTNNARNNFWPSWSSISTTNNGIPLNFKKSLQEFTARETFQAGLGDLDGDGDLDAVFANPQQNNSQVWLNDGNGTLIDKGLKLTQYGHGVALADFDEDGDLDAFIVCHQFVAPSKIYLNDGTGTMSDTGQDLGDKSLSANEVNLLDLNGDGHMDVHVMYYSPGGLPDKVYLNDGHANFSDSGLALDEEPITWGDLDGDGDVDYFGKQQGKGYVVQLNDGTGQFSKGWQMDDEQATIGGVALADFDSDGDLDALVLNGFRNTGSLPSRLFLNDGTGQFTDSSQTLNKTQGAEIAVGDLDLDGDLDVFIANMDLPNEIWLNDGSGQFMDSGLRLEGNNSTKPTLGDLDGDGDLDMFVGSLMNKPQIWINLTRK